MNSQQNDNKIISFSKNNANESNNSTENYPRIYFILCYHKSFLDNIEKVYSNSENNEIKIELTNKNYLHNKPDYSYVIYSCAFNKGIKIPKKLELGIIINNKNYYFKEIDIKPEKNKFVFDKLTFKNEFEIIQLLDIDKKIPTLSTQNFYYSLNIDEMFSFYFDYLYGQNDNQKNNLYISEYSNYLINNYITSIKTKKNLEESRDLNSLIKLFILCYNKENEIKLFLDTISDLKDLKIKMIPDKSAIIINKFTEILNLYQNSKFTLPLKDSLKKEDNLKKKNQIIEKYNKKLEYFINIYYIIYDKQKIKIDEKNVNEIELILKKFLRQSNDISEFFDFIIDKFEIIEKIKDITVNNFGQRYSLKIENNFDVIEFKKCLNKYNELIKKQKYIFIDFSKSIEKHIKDNKENLMGLKESYIIFKKELNNANNIKLLEKLRNHIHNLGIKLYKKGELINEQIIDFLQYDDYYKTSIDRKKKEKDIFILEGINIKSKNDILINEIVKNNIYDYFKEMPEKYLDIFLRKLNQIKDLDAFFQILPDNYFNQKALNLLKDWIKINIRSFAIGSCPNFQNEINHLFTIMTKKGCTNYIIEFIDFFSDKLGDICNNLFIFILNNNIYLNTLSIDELIRYFTKQKDKTLDSIKFFIENLKKIEDGLIMKFYEQISDLCINDKDFYNKEKTNKYKLMEILLLHKEKFLNNKKGLYIDYAVKKCQNLIKDLEEQNLSISNISDKNSIILMPESTERIQTLFTFLNEVNNNKNNNDDINNKSIDIYTNLIKNYKEWDSNIDDLKEVIEYYDVFFKDNKEKEKEKKNIKSLINGIKKDKLNVIENKYTKEYNKYNELIKEANNKLKLNKYSLLFKEIYEANKKNIKDQYKLLNDTFKNFMKAVQIIGENPEKIQNNEFIHYFFGIGYKNESDLDKEIDWLIAYLKKKIKKEQKEKLLQSLKILVKKQSLENIIKAILSFIKIYEEEIKSNENDKEFINELKKYSEKLKKNISSLEIEGIINYIKKKFNKITFEQNDSDYKEKILDLFVEFNKNNESFKFLKDEKLSQNENLKEFLLDVDENDLTINDLDEYLKVIRFLNNDINKSKNKIDLINNLINGVLKEEKCGNCLKNILKKIDKLKKFKEQIIKGEEGCFIKIQRIMVHSYFCLKYLKEEDVIKLVGFYEKNYFINAQKVLDLALLKNKEQFNYNSLEENELDNLYQKIFISKHQSNAYDGIKQFINFYKEITKIKNILNKLYCMYGYSFVEDIWITIDQKIVNCAFENKNYSLKELRHKFYEIKNNCKNYYEEVIKNNKEIRFFNGKQLYLLYSCIKDKKYNEIKDLLRCISNDNINKFNDNIIDIDNNKISHYEYILKSIQNYISKQLKYNNCSIDRIYQNNKVADNYKNILSTGFYFFTKEIDLELFLITTFFNLTLNFPSTNNLLLCNKDTCIEEIQCILNQAINCEFNSLFIIAKCELLNAYTKRKFIYELKEKSSIIVGNILVVIFSDKDSDLHKSILKIKHIKQINLENLKNINISMDNSRKKVEIITSRGCGFGKSTYIQNKINSKIIYFPLGGDLNRKDINKRIENEIENTYKNENYILHITLGQTNDIEMLKEFIFKLLIFRKCDFNNNVKFFGSNVNIKIEIPNDFMDYLKIIKILLLFESKNILQLSKINLTREVKIVSTFLMKYEARELLVRNINNLETDCNPSEKQCQDIILKYIGIQSPNFYQINTFVKILANELELFNSCDGLKPKSLILTGIPLDLRNIIVESLIKVTKYFTIGPYEDLIKSQQKVKEILNSNDEEKDLYIYGALHLNINSVSYDDINPSLVTFNQDKNSITIITSCDKNQKEYIDLNKLYKSQSFEFQKKYGWNNIRIYRNNYKILLHNSKSNKNELSFEDDLEYIGDLIQGNKKDNITNKNIINNNLNNSDVINNRIKNINNNNIINTNNNIKKENIELMEMKALNDNFNKSIENEEIPNLKIIKNLDADEIYDKLLIFLNVNGLSDEEKKNLIGNYIYTPDNFIKIVLILMRLRAKVPVVMMGETGCGKTALIKMAYKLTSKYNQNMYILNIHAGTDDNDIIDFINETKKDVKKQDNLLFEEKKMKYDEMPEKDRFEYEKTTSREQQFEGYKRDIDKREIWIFFDEINTCNSMGLLSEILCQHTIRGKSIDERYVFIAACNPYRLLSKENKIENILFHKKAKKKKLVYSVNPLPHSLLNYVFNFGCLKEDDEKKYIKSMIKEPTKSIYNKYNTNIFENDECQKLMNFETEIISLCQIYMKEKNDVSVVSLREVNRFIIFFKFFVEFIINRNKEDDDVEEFETFYKTNYETYIHAINLAIYICYYLRLPDKITRKELEKKINDLNYFNGNFLKIPEFELNYLINNLEVPVGIAKNQALKENLFSSFFCIVNKIPLIICGKPGRSKTLSIQIIGTSMKGKEASKSYICKKFGELYIQKIQGALNTTSKEIKDTFENARKLQAKYPSKIILVLMDEMGLAEISNNNPLKVTHYELENEENKVAFIGISNWGLDASKMNRVIYIIGQEPDENDIILTSKEIVRSYELNSKFKKNYYEMYQMAFDNLAKAYYSFIQNKKIENNNTTFFHGSRDFYSLIKTTTIDFIKNLDIIEGFVFNRNKKNDKINEICLKNIERNFGGLTDSINNFKSIFYELFTGQKETQFFNNNNLMTCLKESLYDNSSRYLLIISDSIVSKDILFYLIEEINNQTKINDDKSNNVIKIENNNNNIINIKDEDDYNDDEEEEIEIDTIGNKNIKANKIEMKYKQIKYYLGSKFKEDEEKIFYCDDMLNKIKYQMEKNVILILKDLEIVYPSLYELFNRNFFEAQGKKFTYLGKSQTRSLVNDDFKVIVYLDKQNVDKEDPPFLNRFEKHLISIDKILGQKYINFSYDIYDSLKDIISFKFFDNDKVIETVLNNNLKFVEIEEIQGLIFVANKNNIKKEDDIIEDILKKIVPTFTEDMIVYMEKYGYKLKYTKLYEKILSIYKKNYRYNIYNYLEKTENRLSILYTFSSINDIIFELNNKFKLKKDLINKYYKQNFNKETFKEIFISEITSINYLDKLIVDYLSDSKKNLCILKFREEDLDKLENVINLIEDYIINEENYNLINEDKNIQKLFIILIHLSRTKTENKKPLKNNFITYLSKIPQLFIDNINNYFNIFLDIYNSPNEEIVFRVIHFDELAKKFDIYLRNFSYNIIGGLSNNDVQNTKKYRIDIVEKIRNDSKVKEIIQLAIKLMSKNDEDYLSSVLCDKRINKEGYDFIDSLSIYLSEKMEIYIRKLIYLFDQNQIFTCILSNKDLFKSNIIKKYLNDYINNINNDNLKKISLNGINYFNKKDQNILLGVKTPFIQNILKENILNYIKNNIAVKYIQYDSYLMRSKISYERIETEKEKYKNQMTQLETILKNEIINFPIINEILQSDEKILIKNLFNDAFYIFLSKNNSFKNNYDKLIQLLDIIIQIRLNPIKDFDDDDIEFKNTFLDLQENEIDENELIYEKKQINQNRIILDEDEEEIEDDDFNQNLNIIQLNNIKKSNKNYIKIFTSVMNFIESYSKEIYDILELYNYMCNECEEDSFKQIKELIIKKKINMNDERNQDNFKYLKACFFYVIESLLMNIRKSIKNDGNPYKFYKKIRYYLPNIIKLEYKLLLFSKEIFTLELIDKIIGYYDRQTNKSISLDNINKLISLVVKEPEITDIKLLLNNIKEMISLLKDLYGDTSEFGELKNDIILNKYKIYKNNKFREDLINDILLKEKKNNNLYSFISLIIGDANKFETNKIMSREERKNYINIDGNLQLKFVMNNQELILFYFENIIEKYFLSIKKEDLEEKEKYHKLLESKSLNYLDISITNLSQKNFNKINIIRKIYLIAYIKRYLSNYLDLILSSKHTQVIQYLSERNNINRILFSKNITLVKEIKLFTLKLIFLKYNNLGMILNLHDNNCIDVLNGDEQYFNDIINNQESILLYYFSYPLLNNDKEGSLFKLFDIKDNKNSNNDIKVFEPNDYKKFLSNIKTEEKISSEKTSELYNSINDKNNKNNKYDIIYTYISYMIYRALITKNIEIYFSNSKEIFDFFSKRELFGFEFSLDTFLYKELLQNIKDVKDKDKTTLFRKFEILLYAYRFYFNILTAANKGNKNNFYYSLSKIFIETINSNFIPGKIVNNEIKASYEKIKDNLIKNPKCVEYMCSCGNNYSLANHNESIKCFQCQSQKMKTYSLFGKNNYYGRIFLNDNERKSFYLKYPKNESYLLLNELEKKIEDQIKPKKGLNIESKEIFFQKNNSNDFSYITFRLLNFILYGFIFYLNKEGKITDEEIKGYLIDGMTCFEILEKDWEILDKEIKLKEIPNIHIFLDSIFNDIIKVINSQKSFTSEKILKNYEKSIEKIIEKNLKDKELINNYLKNRNDYLDIEPNEELAIITEEEKYNNNWKELDNKYKELLYFTNIKLPSLEDFKKEFYYNKNNKDYYPIINYILDDNSPIKYLKYLPKINELCNFMINYCSYKYTREEANSIKIKDEIKDKDDLINEFMDIYDELRKFVNNYECHKFENEKGHKYFNSLLKEKYQYLSNFCVDIGEFNYGMVLVSIYRNMIYWQNSFINKVIYSNNESHKKYKELFENEIMIQDSNEDCIIKLPSKDDLIPKYILKNVNQNKYGILIYNFKLIEEELASDILPNIRKYVSDNDKCLKYVVYQYEGFRGNKDNIITIFNEKYERKELTEEENLLIIKYIEEHDKETKKIINFWFSLQILIDIILENNYNGEMLISNIINKNNQFENLNILNELFGEENMANNKIKDKKLFKVNSMLSIFYWFEFICWNKIKENLSPSYLIDIDKNIKEKIDNFFNDKNNKIITKANLSTAIRRFVSRYLSGKRSENEIKETNNIIYYLCKEELWDEKDLVNNPEFDKELSLLFDTDKSLYMISVGQATKVYEYLGDEIQLNEERNEKNQSIFAKLPNPFLSAIKIIRKKINSQENKEKEDDDLNDINRSNSNISNRSSNSSEGNFRSDSIGDSNYSGERPSSRSSNLDKSNDDEGEKIDYN